MAKGRWFGLALHVRQERATYGTLLAVVAASGTAMIVLGGLQIQAVNTRPDLWGNPLVDIGILIVVIAAVATLLMALVPVLVRPKLRFGGLAAMPFQDAELLRQAGPSGIRSATLIAVKICEENGVRARDVEVWVTEVSPRPTHIEIPRQLAAYDSNQTYGDVPASNYLYFALWASGESNAGTWIAKSRIGWFGDEGSSITMEIRREGRTHEQRTYAFPSDLGGSPL